MDGDTRAWGIAEVVCGITVVLDAARVLQDGRVLDLSRAREHSAALRSALIKGFAGSVAGVTEEDDGADWREWVLG